MSFRKALMFVGVAVFTFGTSFAMAQDGAAAGGDSTYLRSFGVAIALGIAALGGALGQGKAVSAALEGIARNPATADKLFTPMILGLVFIESLVIYALVIAFMKM